MKYQPAVSNAVVDEAAATALAAQRFIPSLLFADPYGYKGLTLQLINAILKDWGSECIFFFNYNRIYMGLNHKGIAHHIDAIFGKERADALRAAVNAQLRPDAIAREELVLAALRDSLSEIKGTYTLAFRFRRSHDVPLAFIQRVFATMQQTPQHTFQILTKRAERLEKVAAQLEWPANIWMGVSVENADYTWRIDHLRRVPAAVRFLSIEPLLGPITNLALDDIHWVIVGGESGPRARPVDAEWVRVLRELCQTRSVAFFFKQWGGVQKGRNGRELDGRTWEEMPTRPKYDLRLSLDNPV